MNAVARAELTFKMLPLLKKWHVKTYICIKFDGFNSKNEPRNAKTTHLVKQSITLISKAEPP